MLGIALMDLKGLRTLIVRSAFRLGMLGISAIKLISTTVKSRIFQGFLRYDRLCRTKPNEIIFKDASVTNNEVKALSIFSRT